MVDAQKMDKSVALDEALVSKLERVSSERGQTLVVTHEMIKGMREQDIGNVLIALFDLVADHEKRINALEGNIII